MDDVPERRDDEATRTDVPVARPESSGPPTDRVRIVGAETAGEATSVLPVVGGHAGEEDDRAPGAPSVRLTGEPGDGDADRVNPVGPGQTAVPSGTAAPTELPHWTEPPTGQVPAVLARDGGEEGPGPAIGAPTWREEDADWNAHDEEFEPAMFGDDRVALGSLDESDGADADRRPWEFDLASSPPASTAAGRPEGRSAPGQELSGAETIAPITEPVALVPAESGPGEGTGPAGDPGGPAPGREPIAATWAAGAGWVGAGGHHEDLDSGPAIEPVPFGDEPVGTYPDPDDEPVRPTGSPRVGRARRNGLLPARLRAKRPEEVDALTGAPLAAEPPGASVTDVPGAGRKRGGVAGLAAADRTAERDLNAPDAVAEPVTERARPGSDGVDMAATAAVAAGVARRRPRRFSLSDRPVASDAGPGGDGPTGGGPPPRRPEARSAGRGVHEGGSSIGLRVGTGIAVAVIALVAFKLGTLSSVVLCAIVVTFAAGECFGVLRKAGYHPATLLGLVGTISLMVGAYSKGVAALPLVLVLLTAFTLIWYLLGIERGSPVAGTAATMLTVGWVSLLGAYAGLLLSPSLFPDRHGIAFLLGAIIATVANDVGALVIGGWMGRRPLAPSVSPNKTWEGFIGGAVVTVVVATVVVGNIHPWGPGKAALLGLVVSVVAPIGDLCESLLKRDLRLKDMGTLLPGHGGVLDRVDALLFVLPATYYLVRALNIG